MKYAPLVSAIALALVSTHSVADDSNIEIIEVKGSYFNNYKVDNASGAMRGDMSLLETAQSVSVINDIIINEQLATTLSEVLQNDASLIAGSKQRNREVFNLRGFELSSNNGYLRDGHQHWSHYQQPIEILESVEVIKGPSSILYGQSAPGGLVNMVTKKPTFNRFTTVGADVDHLGSTRFTLDSGGALNDDESLRYRGVLVQQNAVYEREYQNGEQRERDRLLGALVLDYDVTDNLLVRFHADQTNDKAGLDTGAWLNSDGNVIGDNKTIRDMSWAFTDITVNNLGVDVEYALNNEWQLKAGINKQNFERQRFESAPKYNENVEHGQSYTSRPYDRFDDWEFSTAYLDLTADLTLAGMNHQLLIGANGLNYYYQQTKYDGQSFDYTVGDSEPDANINYDEIASQSITEYHYYGFYFQDLISLNDQWQISLGGRYDIQKKDNADNETFLPKAGILYHPSDEITLYASYSEGFEPQTTETIVDDSDVNYGMELEAMTSEQFEIGAKWQLLDDRLLLTGAIFDITKNGMLVTEDYAGPGDYQTITTQAGTQRHQGFELGAQGSITDRLFLMTSVMQLDAAYGEDNDVTLAGNTPIDVPKWSASLWSRYEFNEKIAINAGAFYQGERYADVENTIVKDAYTRIDIGATYSSTIYQQEVNFRFNIENLLDKTYLAGGSYSSVTVEDGRHFRLSMQMPF
ncbi:TonB-dependent siderophore receptor [Thalassotalea sp. PLHSN55]|uniref:TonB-dependent siderophore receptor n=1 Tax=Thalassotalea sp. PLHSN55 TaxID=3435888 RepID=UPI003F859EC2